MITLNDKPGDMFHKVMLWSHSTTPRGLELCTRMPMSEIEQLKKDTDSGNLSGTEAKRVLARRIVTELHGAKEAEEAEKLYDAVTSRDIVPDIEQPVNL